MASLPLPLPLLLLSMSSIRLFVSAEDDSRPFSYQTDQINSSFHGMPTKLSTSQD